MTVRIVGVHGVGNRRAEPPAEASQTLAAIWSRNLVECLGSSGGRLDLKVAYYAHLLFPKGRQGGPLDLEELDAEALALVHQWLAECALPVGVEQGRMTMPLRQAISWLAHRRHLPAHAVELFVSTFFSEVARYLDRGEEGCRHAVRAEVARAIETHRATVVIAHSLGSVVTYETLWAYQDLHVDLLVTLGSPLALPHAVFPRLVPAPQLQRGSRPPNVRRWVNLADPGDLVAIPVNGVSRSFHGVDLDEHDTIHAFDFHRIANYLRCSALGRTLSVYLHERDAFGSASGCG